MLHEFSTEKIDDIREQVFIDGKPIRCYGYTLTHNVNEFPSVELKLICEPKIDGAKAIIQVSNKEEIARLMDKAEFEEFCEIWKEVHE